MSSSQCLLRLDILQSLEEPHSWMRMQQVPRNAEESAAFLQEIDPLPVK